MDEAGRSFENFGTKTSASFRAAFPLTYTTRTTKTHTSVTNATTDLATLVVPDGVIGVGDVVTVEAWWEILEDGAPTQPKLQILHVSGTFESPQLQIAKITYQPVQTEEGVMRGAFLVQGDGSLTQSSNHRFWIGQSVFDQDPFVATASAFNIQGELAGTYHPNAEQTLKVQAKWMTVEATLPASMRLNAVIWQVFKASGAVTTP